MNLLFIRENGLKHAFTVEKHCSTEHRNGKQYFHTADQVATETADGKATRVFAEGCTVRLHITFDDFQRCIAEPQWGIAAGLCEILEV